jgi:hypothetical protein
MQILGKPIKWVEIARYLGAILDTQLAWSAQFTQVAKKTALRLGVICLSLKVEGACPSETVCCSASTSFDI